MIDLKLRGGVWYVMGTVKNLDGEAVQIRKSTGFGTHQKAHAQLRMSQMLSEVVKTGGMGKRPYQETVSELVRIYCGKPGGVGETNLRHLASFEDVHGKKKVGDLTTKEINDWGYGDGLKSEYVRRRIGAVNTMLTYCGEYGVQLPPKLKGKPPGASRGRTRWLTKEERDRFIEAFGKNGDYWRALAVFLFFTGARIGETLKLRWRDVAGEQATVSSRKGVRKMEKPRAVPLVHEVREALARLPKRNEWVFSKVGTSPLRYPTVSRMWTKTCKELGIEDFTPHDARHTFASLLGQSGAVDLHELKDLLGHEDIQMTLRYKHLIPGKALRAVSVLSAHIEHSGVLRKAG